MEENLQFTLYELNSLENFRDVVSINYNDASISDNLWPFIGDLISNQRLPDKLKLLVSNTPRCKFAYSNSNQQYAILLDGQLEIRGAVSGSYKILSDPNPNWRKCVWSASGNLLICSRSLPILDVFDVRNFCYSVHIETGSIFDPIRAVAEIASIPKAVNNTWSDEVYVLQFCGIINIYYMGRISGYHPVVSINLHNFYPSRNLVTTAMILIPEKNLIVVGTVFDDLISSNGRLTGNADVDFGIFTLRLLDSHPFLATVNQSTPTSSHIKQIKSTSSPFFSVWTSPKFFVQQLLLNSDRRKLACIVSSTDVVVFSFGSGKKIMHYSSKSAADNERIILGIAWWTNELILIAFSDGDVKYLNVANQNSTEMIKFSSYFSFHSVTDGHFFVLEQNFSAEDKLNLTKRAPSLIYLLAKLPYECLKRLALIFVGASPVEEAPPPSFSNEPTENSFPISYSLQEIKATTPEELFETKLLREEFSEALTIAEKYNLDRDKVFQTQWLKGSVTVDQIDQYLSKIKNHKWVVDECVRKISQSGAESCRYLLKYGLKLTKFLEKTEEKRFTNDDTYFFHQRLRLLKYLDRLEDYEETRQFEKFSDDENSFDAEFYSKIRNLETLSMALHLARNNNFLSLRILFRRYKPRLYPYWLFVLNNICETVDVESYEFLLPQADKLLALWDDEPRRKEDFAETSQIYADILHKNDVDESNYVRLQETPPSLTILSKWYEKRALEIERLTGLPDLAENFLIKACKFGFEDLKLLRNDLTILRRLNYSCKLENAVGYHNFIKFTPFEVANELLKQKTGENFARDFFGSVVPYFKHCEFKHVDRANRLMYSYLLELSKNSLKPLLFILQHTHKHQDADDAEISLLSDKNLIELATDCLNLSDDQSADHLETAFKILAFLPPSDGDDRSSSLNLIERRLKALEILSLHEIHYSYSHFRTVSENLDDTLLLLKRLVRRTIDDDVRNGADFKRSTLHWKNLLKDMINLCELSFSSTITKSTCREIFVDGLLCSKNRSAIQSSTSFIAVNSETGDDKISLLDAQRLILSAGLSYINESISGADETLEYAKLCFALLKTPSEDIRRELDFVQSLPILESFGIKELPTRIRLYVDRSRLLDEIFDRNPFVYKEIKRISSLSRLLRVPNDNIDDVRSYALTKCAKTALDKKDYATCGAYCKEIMDSDFVNAWKICRSLAVDDDFKEKRMKNDLLKFSLAHCGADDLESTLTSFVRSKSELLVEKYLDADISSSTFDSDVNIYFDQNFANDYDRGKKTPFIDVRLDSIYCNPYTFKEKNEATLDDETITELLDFVHFLTSQRSKVDAVTLEKFYFELARRSMTLNSMFSCGILLNVNDWQTVERCLSTFASSPTHVELVAYLASLTFVRSFVPKKFPLLSLPPRLLISLVPHLCSSDERKTKEFMQIINKLKLNLDNYQQIRLLNQLPEGLIDQRRFETDEKYRRDSILGFALSTEEKSYLTSVRLAERFDVDEWDVHWAHLTFLFTDSGLDAADVQEYTKKRHLIDKLVGKPEIIAAKFLSDVYPLLSGTKYQILLLYYVAVEKLCGDLPIGAEVQTHRTLLRHFMKYAPGIDYKKLVDADDPTSLDVVMPYLNADNFKTFAKVLTKIPTKNVTLENVFSVWAKKVFVETKPKVGVDEAFAKCRPVLMKLNIETFLDFARGVLLSDQSNELFRSDIADRLKTLDLCINFAKSEKPFEIVSNQLESWRSIIAPSSADGDKIVELDTAHATTTTTAEVFEDFENEEGDDVEKLIRRAKRFRQDGKIREAGLCFLQAHEVPPSFATHNAAMCLIKKFDSLDDG